MVVHEEYRQHGAQLLLNDIGKVAGRLLARGALADVIWDVAWCNLVHPYFNPEELDGTLTFSRNISNDLAVYSDVTLKTEAL
jgi:hypothetical protein